MNRQQILIPVNKNDSTNISINPEVFSPSLIQAQFLTHMKGFDTELMEQIKRNLEMKVDILKTSKEFQLERLSRNIDNNDKLSGEKKKEFKTNLPKRIENASTESICRYLDTEGTVSYLVFINNLFYDLSDFERTRAWTFMIDENIAEAHGYFDENKYTEQKARKKMLKEAKRLEPKLLVWADKAYAKIDENMWDTLADLKMLEIYKKIVFSSK